MAEGDITLDAPPEVQKASPANPLARLLPVAVLVATGGMMALYFTSGAATTARGPIFVFFPIMMLASVLGSLAYGTRGANQTAQLNEDRRAYLSYLDAVDQAIAISAVNQHRSLHWIHPDPDALWTLPGGPRMWERGIDDPDFCHVRVGRGDQPLSTTLVTPELGPVEGLDPVTSSALQRLIRRRAMVADVPGVVGLRTISALTVDADPTVARALLRAIVCQLAVLHGPDDVRIAAVVGPSAGAEWDWLKWLPHHQHPGWLDAVGPFRMTYRSLGEAIAGCRPLDDNRSPHVVIVVDDGSAPVIEQPFTAGRRLKLRLDGDMRPDSLTPSQAAVCARRLAPYRPACNAAARHPSATIGWLELMGIDVLASIDPVLQWSA
ncbi:MAG TPA: type VII secretion protein EccC, partial [Mycobacterium sp.]|nr:type VII secretion protein EccC [Mycobacterium sp.]